MTTTHKFCTHCGRRNNLSAKVCSQCGQAFRPRPQPMSRTCSQCGAVSQRRAKVCKICGYRFEVSLPPQPAEPPLIQPMAAAVVLPPAAVIPPVAEPPAPSASHAPDLERYGGQTGIIPTPQELERLRQTRPEQKVLIVNRQLRKKPR
jgi:RNA polymerase subunit RPABC4/transcription elongation factor Spt4